MKMHKVKPKKDQYAIGGSMRKEESKPHYPTIRIEHEHLPGSEKFQPGEKHHIHIIAHVVGNSNSRFQKENEYELHKVGSDGEEHEEGKAAEEDADEDKKDVEDDHDDTED